MKNIKCIYLLPVICICFLLSCSDQSSNKKFFDVPGYFKEEIEYIKTNLSTVQKTSIYNGSVSRDNISVADIVWEREFALFLECDINKPVYFANMDEISTPSHADEPKFGWSDGSKRLPIRYVMIGGYHYGNTPYSPPSSIKIQMVKSNLISETIIDAIYIKDSIYEIKGEQRIKNLGDKNTFYVKGDFN